MLKEKLRHVSELKATFAMWNASGSNDLDALIRAIDGILSEYKDEMAKRKDRKKAAAAKASATMAAAGKAGGKGNKNRTKDKVDN